MLGCVQTTRPRAPCLRQHRSRNHRRRQAYVRRSGSKSRKRSTASSKQQPAVPPLRVATGDVHDACPQHARCPARPAARRDALPARQPPPAAKSRAAGPLTPPTSISLTSAAASACAGGGRKTYHSRAPLADSGVDRPRRPTAPRSLSSSIGLRHQRPGANINTDWPSISSLAQTHRARAVIAPPPCHKIAVRIAHHSGIDVL